MAPKARIRPYKDFLTPLLHRRFALATATLCMLCYIEALLICEWNSFFWSWFPFGRAGIRTGLLFIPAFSIFILRVAQLHVGIRTSFSAWQTFTNYSPKFHAIQSIGWYFFSAWLYSEIYIWSIPKDADLNRIKLIPKTDRPILNERPIYFTFFLLFLAVVQAGFHLFYDYDRIDMPVQKTSPKGAVKEHISLAESPSVLLKNKLPTLAANSLRRAVVVAFVAPIMYSIDVPVYPYSIRRFAWNLTRSWAKVFWSLPKSGALPSIRPFHWSLLLRTVTSGFLLVMLWEVGNAAFTAYVSQEPLKNERPITYESRDPNGSLLTGLKGKKLQTRAFAFWELVYIAERFQGRRMAIFEDIDRAGGSTWSQILAVCLETVNGVKARIAECQSPSAVSAATTNTTSQDVSSLPRLGRPIKDGVIAPGDIFTSPLPPKSTGPAIVQAVGDFSKKHGQSPPTTSPRSRKLLQSAQSAVLAPTQGAASSPGINALFREWMLSFLKSKFGWLFRQEYRRRMAAVVLGTPYGDVGIIVDAIDSLTRLAVCSLTEDKYGNVQRDLKLIIQTFTSTVNHLEAFQKTLGVHWTDVEKMEESPEADIILNALKSGLHELVEAFEGYSEDLRLSQTEMRMAREAMTTPVR